MERDGSFSALQTSAALALAVPTTAPRPPPAVVVVGVETGDTSATSKGPTFTHTAGRALVGVPLVHSSSLKEDTDPENDEERTG